MIPSIFSLRCFKIFLLLLLVTQSPGKINNTVLIVLLSSQLSFEVHNMAILVIRKLRHREVKSPGQALPSDSLHHFKGSWLSVTCVTSTPVSLAQVSQITLQGFRQVRKGTITMCLEVENLIFMNRFNDATSHGDTVSSMREGFCLVYPPNPGTWHRSCYKQDAFGMCSVDHRTYHIAPTCISMTEASRAPLSLLSYRRTWRRAWP